MHSILDNEEVVFRSFLTNEFCYKTIQPQRLYWTWNRSWAELKDFEFLGWDFGSFGGKEFTPYIERRKNDVYYFTRTSLPKKCVSAPHQ